MRKSRIGKEGKSEVGRKESRRTRCRDGNHEGRRKGLEERKERKREMLGLCY